MAATRPSSWSCSTRRRCASRSTSSGPLDVDTATRIGLRLLEALEAAHRVGLVHRDVKPSNILLCHDGRVKIADFGIAKADDQTELTREGSLLGTATYLAPEQLTGTDIDGRADLYSLGIVLYESVVGHVPFEGDTGAAVALARLHRAPIDPRRLRADIPPSFAAVLMRALEREPDDRYASAAEFRAALLDSSERTGPVVLEPLPADDRDPTETTPSFTRSERRWLLPALFIILDRHRPDRRRPAGEGHQPLQRIRRSHHDDQWGRRPAGTAHPRSDGDVRSRGTGRPRGERRPRGAGRRRRRLDTAWRTESYEQTDFFGSKKGVGLGAVLPGPSAVSRLSVTGSDTGWDAEVYVLPDAGVDGVDLSTLQPVGQLTDVRGSAEVGSRAERPVTTVLLWITNLGDPGDEGDIGRDPRSPSRAPHRVPDHDGGDRRTCRPRDDRSRSSGRRPPVTDGRCRSSSRPHLDQHPRGVPVDVPGSGRCGGRHPGGTDRDRPGRSSASTDGPASRRGTTGSR